MRTPRFNGLIPFSATTPRKNARGALVAFCKGFAMAPNREAGKPEWSFSATAAVEQSEAFPT